MQKIRILDMYEEDGTDVEFELDNDTVVAMTVLGIMTAIREAAEKTIEENLEDGEDTTV